jgi:hypothetical protein
VPDRGPADEREDEVHERAGCGHDRHALLRPLEIARVDRHGFRPSERQVRDECGQDEHQRSQWIDVHEGIQGQPPL